MIDAIVKLAGSLFIGGIGLLMILVVCLLTIVFVKELIHRYKDG
jgi:hypothetical protein